MRQGIKGFTLIELLITVAVMVIAVTMLVPAFTTLIARNRANADMAEIARALGYARLEAINQGLHTRLMPVPGQLWAGQLQVAKVSASASLTVLRLLPALGGSATLGVVGNAGTPDYIEFNGLGALDSPSVATTLNYVNGSEARTVMVCVNGRVVIGGNCG
ncbi:MULTISPECIES: GspH/FimT family pseudopilin [Pseudomonas]|uniref:Type II secretion system protein H n=1 Tax=Pseudomonas quercus TaxID=2722792 RepID=A0ABX0YH11_9PSED|nr:MULTISPECIES: GspH/FimT family pseudopilin [Pseudomonas]MBF7142959.1 GspH/FimT family pseudopilin [Pseudomonas sp. LY10J]NJP01507.1 prepilin-type N-terminal cleavage/methylation domain-containing protein [Pseudomonas quercus]